MAIYSRWGTAVQILEARCVPVWMARGPGEVRRYYKAPKPRRGWTVEEWPAWFIQAAEVEGGQPLCDGKWQEANAALRADDGWREIEAELKRLAPNDAAKMIQWNKADAPAASEMFDLIDEKAVA